VVGEKEEEACAIDAEGVRSSLGDQRWLMELLVEGDEEEDEF
jgi:hypothetical protein